MNEGLRRHIDFKPEEVPIVLALSDVVLDEVGFSFDRVLNWTSAIVLILCSMSRIIMKELDK